ncbi:hypothetical protein QBC46DRAFT_414326 [Diplogelasinospora grovesii]|uniref:Uncharacterized protein n=1 Tax=Diplogelasinospora grovesii TaxID=303347 RepID=A0AAN6MY15_9PEZI|nr:hypothetical protein QBC46DRAFT_414326 [Diplogelasinospora grovesii]
MEIGNPIPAVVKTCSYQPEQPGAWFQHSKARISPSPSDRNMSYISLANHSPCHNFLSLTELYSDLSSLQIAHLSPGLTFPVPHSDPVSWIERLEKLEDKLQDPVLQQPRWDCLKLDKPQILIKGVQLKIIKLQNAVSGLENWAQRMDTAYGEFKEAVENVFKLVNS